MKNLKNLGDTMVSIKDAMKFVDEKHKLDSIPSEYTVVKVEDVIDKPMNVMMFSVYHDKKNDLDKVAIGGILVEDGTKVRIHTSAIRIVEVFREIKGLLDAGQDVDFTSEKITIKKMMVNNGVMLYLSE